MKITCYHSNSRPTGWNQTKPAPTEIETCECGENWTCPVCGFGQGAYPCACMRKRMKELNKKDKRFSL